MKFCFCQVSTNLINAELPKDSASLYYQEFWEKKGKDGYYKPDDFWELPLWIARLSYILRTEQKELFIVKNSQDNLPEANYYLFSVLEVNKDIIKGIAKRYPQKRFILGGYVDENFFADCPNVSWHTVESLCKAFELGYSEFTDYSLFSGFACVPRLTLSTGCKNKCRFCTVEKTIQETDLLTVKQQIESFKPLRFKLIYLNDKTFGQSENWHYLKMLYRQVKKYNSDFVGFIVQTTCQQVIRFDKDGVNLSDYHVFAVELGLETFSDRLLRYYRKPQTRKTMQQAIGIVKQWEVTLIGNVIIGLYGESEDSIRETEDYLTEYKQDFYSLNIYNFAVYQNADLPVSLSSDDCNELQTDKTFRNETENNRVKRFADNVYSLARGIL
jgi:radical SAM superfamily enzyme